MVAHADVALKQSCPCYGLSWVGSKKLDPTQLDNSALKSPSGSAKGPPGVQNRINVAVLARRALGYSGPGTTEIFEILAFRAVFGTSWAAQLDPWTEIVFALETRVGLTN